jgi:hypothetical protein
MVWEFTKAVLYLKISPPLAIEDFTKIEMQALRANSPDPPMPF